MPEASEKVFASHRRRLRSVAYSILGSMVDAEDVVQETWLRWQRQDHATIDNAEAWLMTVASRIAVDELTSARRRRESYVGEWLPEPLVTPVADPQDHAATADSIEMALLVVLENLSPSQRAAFVLCDVFGYSGADAAAMLDKSPAAVRQLSSRARRHVRTAVPSPAPAATAHREVVEAFAAACNGRNLTRLMSTLAPDVSFTSDGGGLVTATRKVVRGRTKVATMLAGFGATYLRKGKSVEIAPAMVNGVHGVVMRADGIVSVYSIETSVRHITALRVIRNPDKLTDVYAQADRLFGEPA